MEVCTNTNTSCCVRGREAHDAQYPIMYPPIKFQLNIRARFAETVPTVTFLIKFCRLLFVGL